MPVGDGRRIGWRIDLSFEPTFDRDLVKEEKGTIVSPWDDRDRWGRQEWLR
jgi:hypothetical protein